MTHAARADKAKKVFPRPVAGSLKPIVRGQTVQYNMKIRAGRGFTLEELKVCSVCMPACEGGGGMRGTSTLPCIHVSVNCTLWRDLYTCCNQREDHAGKRLLPFADTSMESPQLF